MTDAIDLLLAFFIFSCGACYWVGMCAGAQWKGDEVRDILRELGKEEESHD